MTLKKSKSRLKTGGFKKGNTELRDKVNADLKKLYDEGKVDELAKKYGIEDMICLGDK